MPRPRTKQPYTEFGKAVLRVLEERSLTLRSQREFTGIPHSTVSSWIAGVPPEPSNVIAWAQGLGLPVNQWLELAGHPPLSNEPEWEPDIALMVEAQKLIWKYHLDFLPFYGLLKDPSRSQGLTLAEVDGILAEAEQRITEGEPAEATWLPPPEDPEEAARLRHEMELIAQAVRDAHDEADDRFWTDKDLRNMIAARLWMLRTGQFEESGIDYFWHRLGWMMRRRLDSVAVGFDTPSPSITHVDAEQLLERIRARTDVESAAEEQLGPEL